MGNNPESKSFLQKGEGLRILSIKLNSPFDAKVQPFFDFIIDVIPLQPQTSPKQILDKLTNNQYKPPSKDFYQIVQENQDRQLQIKILSTKHRNLRSITITPNRNWNGSKDMIGITVRKQKYDQVFNTYFPVTRIQNSSPVQLAGIKDGEYLLGCLEYPYLSINNFIEGLYDRYFDKEVSDKHVHLAFYNILEDEVSVKPILLKRGWGGEGLLGCEFLQGFIYKFPSNLGERREMVLEERKMKVEKERIKNDIEECDGVSKALWEALKQKKKGRKGKQMQVLRGMIEVPNKERRVEGFKPERENENVQINYERDGDNLKGNELNVIRLQSERIGGLEERIGKLEETLMNVREYLEKVSNEQMEGEKA